MVIFFKVFLPRIIHECEPASRVDVVFDRYLPMSIKQCTRERRGESARQRVTGTAKAPGDWQKFLLNSDNKSELFNFLANMLVLQKFPDKNVYVTDSESVKHVGEGIPMEKCNHEEADTRIVVHLLHALQTQSVGLVRTGDTDVVVILLTHFHTLIAANPAADIWIAFHAGK